MNKPWLFIEKICGIILFAWGLFALYNLILIVLQSAYPKHPLPGVSYSLFKAIIFNHLNILLCLASVYAGALMIFNDKDGWMLGIISSGLYALSFFISSRFNSKGEAQPFFDFYKGYGFVALLFLAIFILLLQKPFQVKYKPATKNWFIMFAVISALLADKLIFF